MDWAGGEAGGGRRRRRPEVREVRLEELDGADRENLRSTAPVGLVKNGVLDDDLLPDPIGHPDLGDRRASLEGPDEDREGRDGVRSRPAASRSRLAVVAAEGDDRDVEARGLELPFHACHGFGRHFVGRREAQRTTVGAGASCREASLPLNAANERAKRTRETRRRRDLERHDRGPPLHCACSSLSAELAYGPSGKRARYSAAMGRALPVPLSRWTSIILRPRACDAYTPFAFSPR